LDNPTLRALIRPGCLAFVVAGDRINRVSGHMDTRKGGGWFLGRERSNLCANGSFNRDSGVAATAGDKRGYSAHDKAPAALDISWCGSRHHQDIADCYVDVLQRRDGDRGG
jgi:hypothetical protein